MRLRSSASSATRQLVLTLATLSGAAAACAAPDEDLVIPVDEQSVHPGINDNFLATDMSVAEFEQRFEVESREVFRERRAIVTTLDLREGDEIADVGAGTGLFTHLFSGAVGPRGTVYAVEIAPNFITHLEELTEQQGWSNVRVVECTQRSAELPRNSVDVAFVCDTYHHFEYPRSTLASLRLALRPGGRLVVLDFERVPGVSSDWILDHVRAGKDEVLREIQGAGFTLEREITGLDLEENYLLVFRSPS